MIREFVLSVGENEIKGVPPGRIDHLYMRDLRKRRIEVYAMEAYDFDKLDRYMRGLPRYYKRVTEKGAIVLWPRPQHDWTIVLEMVPAATLGKERRDADNNPAA